MNKLPDLKNTDSVLRFIEYYAVRNILADCRDDVMDERYPSEAAQCNERLIDMERLDRDDWRIKLMDAILRREVDTMGDVYAALRNGGLTHSGILDIDGVVIDEGESSADQKPVNAKQSKSAINAVIANRRSISREKYMRDKYGEDFVPKHITAKSKALVTEAVLVGSSRKNIELLAEQVISSYYDELTEGQREVLLNDVMLAHYDRLMIHDTTELELLNNPCNTNSKAFFLWHQIKRRYEVDKVFQLSTKLGCEMAACSATLYPSVIQRLKELKVIRVINSGRSGKADKDRITAQYVRLM